MQRVAVRKYDLDDCPATDILFKLDDDTFLLNLRVIDHPTEPESFDVAMTAAQAARWLSEAPEQIAMWGECRVISLRLSRQRSELLAYLEHVGGRTHGHTE